MSRHTFDTTLDDKRVRVVMGWDRPLQYVFMTVENLSASDDEAQFLYDNLDEAVDPSELSLEHFRVQLSRLGVAIPERMFEEVALDQANNVGNRLVDHTPLN